MRLRRDFGIDHYLHDARHVADIQKYQLAVIAPDMDKAGDFYFLADLGNRILRICALHVVNIPKI